MDFFSATSDKMINTIKKELFDVADGAPIVGRDHPDVQEMMALPAPVKNCITRREQPPRDMHACAPAGARCALITCAVCLGDYVLFETLKDVQNDKTTCF